MADDTLPQWNMLDIWILKSCWDRVNVTHGAADGGLEYSTLRRLSQTDHGFNLGIFNTHENRLGFLSRMSCEISHRYHYQLKLENLIR